MRVAVIDRGPFVAGREFDLTEATKQALGFGDRRGVDHELIRSTAADPDAPEARAAGSARAQAAARAGARTVCVGRPIRRLTGQRVGATVGFYRDRSFNLANALRNGTHAHAVVAREPR